MLILMFDFYDDGLYRRWCWCWWWWCGYGGYRCWSLSQKSYDFHLQAILTHFLSPEFVLRTVVSKIYNALLISESSCSKEHLNDTLPPLGVYSCVAGNILGETVSQAFLQVVWMSLNIFEYLWFECLWISLNIFGLNIFEFIWFEYLRISFVWISLNIFEYLWFQYLEYLWISLNIFGCISFLLTHCNALFFQINTATMATIASPLLIMVLVNLVSLNTTSSKILLLTLIAIVNTAVKWQMAKGENQGSQWSEEQNAFCYAWNFGNYPLTTQFQQSVLIPMNENPSLV